MHSRVRRAVASALACAVLAALSVVVAEQGAKAAQLDTWASGVYAGACANSDAGRSAYVDQLQQFATWRTQPVQFTMQFEPDTGNTNWLTIDQPNALISCARYVRQQLSVPMMFAVPMLPLHNTEDPNNTTAALPSLQAGAAGDYDQYWTTLATNLVSHGLGDTVMRIGWEFNGDWFRWSAAADPAAWKAYWIHIVDAMRSVPGQAFRFDYSVALGSVKANPDDADHPGKGGIGVYPGDAYVDYVSISVYDEVNGHPACSDTVTTDCTTPAQRWTRMRNVPYGLDWQADFAARHNKPIGFTEWALATTSSFCSTTSGLCGGGGDDPTFITQFHEWLSDPTSKTGRRPTVAYEIYFNKDHQDNVHRLTNNAGGDSANFTAAEQTYKNLWSVLTGHSPSASVLPSGYVPSSTSPSASSTASPTPTGPPPANAPLYSTQSNRANPTRLSGSRVKSNIYVFVRPSHAVFDASWYLDDLGRHGKPYHVALETPYDLVGAKDEHALAFHVYGISRGTHRLTVLLHWKSGGTSSYTVRFTR